MDIKLPILKCQRCDYRWTPRKTEVKICPRCKSVHWNEPKKAKKAA